MNNSLLAVYSNKNNKLFTKARDNILNYYNNTGSKINKSIGIHYNDYDADNEKIKIWKTTNPIMNIYKIANRNITVTMDDKIKLYENMNGSSFIPIHYEAVDKIPENTDEYSLFFIKPRDGTAAKGVQCVPYCKLKNWELKTNLYYFSFYSKPLFFP